MSREALDLRRFWRIVWRLKGLVGAVIALGFMAGVAYTALTPATYLSSALVALSPSVDIASQAAVVTSPAVLSAALADEGQVMSVTTLADRTQAKRAASGLMAISVRGDTPAQAVQMANAVARSYVAYTSSSRGVVGPLPVQLFQAATSATGTALAGRLFYAAGAGVLAGTLTGVLLALVVDRSDQRLRGRDEIADSIGLPVLASLRVGHPGKPAGWSKLLAGYEPSAADAWRLRQALRALGIPGPDPASRTTAGGSSLAVLSLSRDRKALAVGPQLASFVASRGIPTALVLDARQDAQITSALRAACAATPWPRGPGQLQVAVVDHGDAAVLPAGALAIVVAVVDGHTPRVATTTPASVTVLGVGSGAVTAAQLARVAASAAAGGRDITGILVADPDPGDQTTGRLPQLARQGLYRMPTRTTSAVTESRQ